MNSLYAQLAEIEKSRKEAALCTVVSVRGAAPRKTGAKMIVERNGCAVGTIGGGALEKEVIRQAVDAIQKKEIKNIKYDLLNHLGMCCGGVMELFIEPIPMVKRLYIFGAGHTGAALAKFARDTGFEVFLIDDRDEFLGKNIPPEVNKMHLPFGQAMQALPVDEDTYVVIVTYSHPLDRELLAHYIRKPLAYLGMIGSRRKAEITKKIFIESGVATAEELEKVDMPIGLNIGAEGPEEIAVSILARLIEVKNRKLVHG